MEKAIIKKMRLQLYDPEFNMVLDKLVAQDTEMYHGPSEPHDGPLKVEFCLFERADIDACITYLQKLVKVIPIETKIRKTRKTSAHGEDLRNSFIETIKGVETQEALINLLRDEGFIFLSAEQVEDYELFEVPDEYREFQWMLKLIKEAKDPKNNKYDLTIKVGIKILGEKVDKIILYHFSEGEEVETPWRNPKKPTNYRKLGMAKFPTFMITEERMKFSKELAAYRREKALPEPKVFTPDDFSRGFKRWTPFVDFAEKEELMQIFGEQ